MSTKWEQAAAKLHNDFTERTEMRFLTLVLILLLTTSCFASDGSRTIPAQNPKAFWGTLTAPFTTTDETIIGQFVVEDVSDLSFVATYTVTSGATVAAEIKILGADDVITAISEGYYVDTHAALQSITTTAAQTKVDITGISPCRILVFTTEATTGALHPGSVSLTVRGRRYFKGGEITPW
jgi:hypothetical protein